MARVVFILGAGSSAAGQCPVMANFLSVSRRLAHEGNEPEFAKTYAAVLRVQERFQAANAKGVLDFTNLESLFTAIEMAAFLGGVGGFDEKELLDAKKQLVLLIAGTIDRAQKHYMQYLDIPGRPFAASGPVDCAKLASYISALRGCKFKHDVTVLTFNYDLGVDFSLASHFVPFRYCLSGADDQIYCPEGIARANPVPLLKLHGSLNWVSQRREDEVVVHAFDVYREMFEQHGVEGKKTTVVRLDSSIGRSRLSTRQGVDDLPHIVPPTDSKSAYRTGLSSVWRAAFAALKAAEVIVIAGYSLPDTDVFFRQFFGLGMINETVVRRVFLLNLVKKHSEKIAELFGPLLRQQCGEADHVTGQFSAGIDALSSLGTNDGNEHFF